MKPGLAGAILRLPSGSRAPGCARRRPRRAEAQPSRGAHDHAAAGSARRHSRPGSRLASSTTV
jgi:hypothetical protein